MKKMLPTILCSLLFAQAFCQNKASWGNDIIVNPVAGQYCRSEKVTTGFDGAIYVYRTIAAAPGALTNKWEVLKSTDQGQTFDTFVYAAPFLTGEYRLTAFDMVAAGNDSASFKLFLARCYVDTTGLIDTVSIGIDTLNLYNNTGYAMYLEKYGSYDPYHMGFTSVSLATDCRDKSSGAGPYSLSVVAAKTGLMDSIIVFTDNDGGMALNRKAIWGTNKEIRNVSASIGSASSSTFGRLGIAWDEYATHTDSFGGIKAAFLYPDDATPAINWGPHSIGNNDTFYRRPCITLSQAAGNQGPAMGDIRVTIAYEYMGVPGDIDVMARVGDSLINGSNLNFNNGFSISNATGKQLSPHGVYDPIADKFLYTYYNTADKTLAYVSKDASSTPASAPVVIMSNYRNATSVINTQVGPRMDIDMTQNGKPAFVWNDEHLSMFDAEFAVTAVANAVNATGMILYPNPASERLHLSFTAQAQTDASVQVLDMTGRVMLTSNIVIKEGQNAIPLNVSTIPAGNYFLKLDGKDIALTTRFAVMK